MGKIIQVLIAVSILGCVYCWNCSSDSRCTCVPLGINNYEAQCSNLNLNSSTFPRLFNNVTKVVLDYNNIQELPLPLYKYLPKTIEKLFIEFNNIQHLVNSSFVKLNKLTVIGLAKNNLTYIEVGTFSILPSLQFLDLSANTYLTFRVLRNITYDLQFTNISYLFLNDIHCSSGIITIIFVDDFEHLANTSLQELYLAHNRIGYIEQGALLALPKTLRKLVFSLNALATGPYFLDISLMTGLIYLDVGEMSSFGGTNGLSNCQDWRCPKHWNHGKQRNVQYNPMSGQFYDLPISVPPNLKVLYIQKSHQVNNIRGITFSKKNSLEKIDMHGNIYRQWIGPVRNLHKLKYLDMSDVRGSNISAEFFSDIPALETLNISHNTFGSLFASDENGTIFQHLKQLKRLEIANNFIFSIPEKFLRYLLSLEILDLSSNYIMKWKVSIKHMKNLKYINLSVNRLESLSSKTMKEIDNHLKRDQLNISLKDNPLQCKCETLTFLRWMLKNSHIFIDFNSYHCQIDGKSIDFNQLEIEFHSLEERCSEYTGLIIGLCVAVLIFLFIIICGIVYRYRWRLRYMYYAGRRDYGTNVNKQRFEFDAFISYADEDRDFVLQIAETLEERDNFGLQLHQRDFLAGKSIAENITETIHKCHKTVIMLSTNFLRSKWCIFEFHMARMESIHTRGGGSVIIIVLLEPVKSRNIPMMMMDVIDSDCYVEYSGNEDDQQFYEKLKAAINRN